MSAGSLSLLPPELIRQLCYNLSLNDILNLQKSHTCLELTIDNVFFVDLKHMEVDIEAHEYRLTDVEIHLVKADEGAATVSKVAKNHAYRAAFHAALPRSHRSGLQVLKLDFGFNVASLSYAEIKQILSQYAPYLNDTRRLQHLVLDLKYSTLLASELETLYSIISRELPDTHRISVYTSESLPKANAVNKQKHTNRVACS
ncbi:unnamed protein product [Nippostrongylus brasiliensis]|uniref:F-box domain-containing protein n=1 Tax=Nippostrongylus brasiliensis TaxID=27835 RepID=A0A0N4YG27_NIPBR|nr:unnamed protein product [Nippostrongylus brasiliensis]